MMTSRISRLRRCRSCIALFIAVVMSVCGCAAKSKPPLLPPDAQVSLNYFTGSALSGPTSQIADASRAQGAIFVSVRLVALERAVPNDLLKPIDPDVRLILCDADGESVAPVLRQLRGARWACGGKGGGGDKVARVESVLASGALGRSAEMGASDLQLHMARVRELEGV